MRILHINNNYLDTALHQTLIERLEGLGVENRVFVPIRPGTVVNIQPNENVWVETCFQKWDRLFFDYKQWKIRRRLLKVTDPGRYDCLHAYTLFTDGNCARRLSRETGVPYAVAVRSTDVEVFFARMPHLRGRGVKILRDARKVFFLSEAYRTRVLEKYVPEALRRAIREKSEVIPNGIDDFWTANPPEEKVEGGTSIRLVYAGKINRNKNIPAIQAAMKILAGKGREARLTAVGRVVDEKEYAAVQADPRTVCLPPRPKEQLIGIYRENDVFVMPSFRESFGLVYAEAMSQGLPVIYTAGEGFDGQFPEGEVGFSVNPASPEDIAEKILRAWDARAEMRKRCIQGAARFNWDAIAARYEQIYREIARR